MTARIGKMFVGGARPDWPRARRLVAQLEYERDAREREVEHVGGYWSPAQHCRKEDSNALT